jgi:type IV secretory pathway component VirB8
MSKDERPIAPYIQAIKNNRLLTKVIFILVILLIFSIGTNFYQAGLSTKEFIVIEYKSSSNNFVKIARAGDDYSRNEILIRATLRNYVEDRERIDRITEQERYARVVALSSDNVSDIFRTVYGGDKALVNREGFVRDIDIKSDSIISYGKHQIEFTTTDYEEDKPEEKKTNRWIATLSYQFKEQQVSEDIGLLNPVGLYVEEYRLSKKKI